MLRDAERLRLREEEPPKPSTNEGTREEPTPLRRASSNESIFVFFANGSGSFAHCSVVNVCVMQEASYQNTTEQPFCALLLLHCKKQQRRRTELLCDCRLFVNECFGCA